MLEHVDGVPVLGVIAASGTGKTTLLRAIIPLLGATGLRVGCIKHTHHAFDLDRPGKDSYLLREAGASQVLLGAAGRWALMVETADHVDETLTTLLPRMLTDALDIILVEGFRAEDIPRIEVHRHELGHQPLWPADARVIALASNQRPLPTADVPVFDLDDAAAIAGFVARRVAALAPLRGAPADA